jgi:hypothetical protein
VAVGPQMHPAFVIKVQAVFGANKYPDEQARQRFEAFDPEITPALKDADNPADVAQDAQFVLAVVHVPT